MSLLNSLVGALTGGAQGGQAGGLADLARIAAQNPQLMQVVASMVTADNKHGGLAGLLRKFTEAGLGDQAQSWIGDSESKPVAPAQIEQVFGTAGIERIAQKSGVSAAEAPALLAQVLPALINSLTAGGRPPAQTPASADALLGMIGGLLGKK